MPAEEPPDDNHRGPITRDEELCRMAAFRIRETANRIATLAQSASDDGLRRELLQICKQLLADEHTLIRRR